MRRALLVCEILSKNRIRDVSGSNKSLCTNAIKGFAATRGVKIEEDIDIPLLKRINGFRNLYNHCKAYVKEIKSDYVYKNRPFFETEHEDVRIEYRFKDPKLIRSFKVTADRDHNIGSSTADFVTTKSGTALFYGNLDTTVPKDGVHTRAGFAGIASPRKMGAFHKKQYHTDWNYFTHLMLKIRGDGRVYMLSLCCPGTFDVEKYDVYCYPLHTHGGPYWQFAAIPFSKFIYMAHGRIQEKQQAVIRFKQRVDPANFINSVGITLCDRIDGPFELEIDWIGVYKDATHVEEFAYEFFKTALPV